MSQVRKIYAAFILLYLCRYIPQVTTLYTGPVVLKSARSANSAHTARHWRSSANSQRVVIVMIVSCFDATPTTAVRRPLIRCHETPHRPHRPRPRKKKLTLLDVCVCLLKNPRQFPTKTLRRGILDLMMSNRMGAMNPVPTRLRYVPCFQF